GLRRRDALRHPRHKLRRRTLARMEAHPKIMACYPAGLYIVPHNLVTVQGYRPNRRLKNVRETHYWPVKPGGRRSRKESRASWTSWGARRAKAAFDNYRFEARQRGSHAHIARERQRHPRSRRHPIDRGDDRFIQSAIHRHSLAPDPPVDIQALLATWGLLIICTGRAQID